MFITPHVFIVSSLHRVMCIVFLCKFYRFMRWQSCWEEELYSSGLISYPRTEVWLQSVGIWCLLGKCGRWNFVSFIIVPGCEMILKGQPQILQSRKQAPFGLPIGSIALEVSIYEGHRNEPKHIILKCLGKSKLSQKTSLTKNHLHFQKVFSVICINSP